MLPKYKRNALLKAKQQHKLLNNGELILERSLKTAFKKINNNGFDDDDETIKKQIVCG
jgi:hypothetical protein